MDYQRKKIITTLINKCKKLDFTNEFDKVYHSILSEYIFKKEVMKYVPIDCSKYIEQDKCEQNKLTTFRTNLNKIILTNEINNLLCEFINYEDIELKSNYYVQILQILNKFRQIDMIENKEIKECVLLLISYNINSNLPKNINTNNIRNRIFSDYEIQKDNKYYNEIYNELYQQLTMGEYDLKPLYDFLEKIHYHTLFIKFMKNIFDKAKSCNFTPFVPEYDSFKDYYRYVLNKENKIHIDYFMNSLHTFIGNTSFKNIVLTCNHMVIDDEYYYKYKLFLDSYYNNIPIDKLVENQEVFGPNYKSIFVIYLYGLITKIHTAMNNNFIQFCEMYYKELREYWKNNIKSNFWINFEPDKINEIFNTHNTNDLFTVIDLFKFQIMNFSIKNYIEIKNLIDNVQSNFEAIQKKEKKKKMNIGKAPIGIALKAMCWNKYIGEEIGKHKCLCCNDKYISQLDFHAGHVISEANGGDVTLENLRPICARCNKSMGRTNMDEYMEKYLKQKVPNQKSNQKTK